MNLLFLFLGLNLNPKNIKKKKKKKIEIFMGSNLRRINDMRPALLWHIKWAPHLTVNNRTQENDEMIWVLLWGFIHLKWYMLAWIMDTLFDLSAECRMLHNIYYI